LAPEILPTVVPVAVTTSPVSSDAASQPLLNLAAGQVRRAADGWHGRAPLGRAANLMMLTPPTGRILRKPDTFR